MSDPTGDETVVDATPEQVLAVAEQMVDLPWPADGSDDDLPWVLDGLEGTSLWLAHVLPLAARAEPAQVRALLDPLVALADRRWAVRHRFDATAHTDDARTMADPSAYDRRSAPAGMVRSLGASTAPWWRCAGHAVLLVDGGDRAALLVLPVEWMGRPGAAEAALATPLGRDLVSGDRARVLTAVWEVIRTRDPAVLGPLVPALPAIREVADDADLGGALISNRTHLAHALLRVRLHGEGACLCLAYPDHQLYDVVKEVDRGHVTVVGTVPNPRQWEDDRICACTGCGRRYQVEQGDYHYPWWAWTPRDGGASGEPDEVG
ncbi:hypothetical protein [Nocardioides litoris]|uniref:hypothetical protein n=1 Tax=Nocardioides litoris TaxID=1926648 RepID=UPI00112043ED|nr:hypothetical protein [Nocardioides litoris]